MSKFQPSRCKLLKVEVRTEIICKAVVAAVPTTMKFSFCVAGIAIPDEKSTVYSFLWFTVVPSKSPEKNTNPFSLLCPQWHNGYNKFLPALNCWSRYISGAVVNISKPKIQNAGLQFSLSKNHAESFSNKDYFLVKFQLSTHRAFSSFCNQKRYIFFTVLGLWSCW